MAILRNNKVVHFSINNHQIRFIVATNKGVIIDFGQKCLPPGVVVEGRIKEYETMLLIVEEIVDRWKLKRCKMSFLVPDELVVLRKNTVPAEIHDDEVNSYLYMQLGETLHLPFDQPIIESVLLANAGEAEREVLVVATNEEIIESYLRLFEEASFTPYLIDVSMLSLYRTYYHLGLAEADEHELLIHIGLDTMMLAVFYDYKPVLLNHIALPYSDEQFEVSHSRSGSEFFTWKDSYHSLEGYLNDMFREIERFLSYYQFNLTQNTASISKVVLTGDHPCMKEIAGFLDQQLEIKIDKVIEPLFQMKKGINIPPVYLECIGLTLK